MELRKKSSIGKPMQGVEFLLEYSLDNGSTWNAVTYRENDSIIIPGSCTNAKLADGKLLTDENGIAVYEGLRVYKADGTVILYRVTETKTLNGSSLMPGHIWEGDLVTEKEGEHQFEVAVLMPFKVQEIQEKGGMYFGENAISGNLILCNKENLQNQSSIVLGVPGGGKSFITKEQIFMLMANTDDDILIFDPEGEYAPLVEAMGDMSTVIRISAGGKDRLNAMYMVDGYGENDPIVVRVHSVSP